MLARIHALADRLVLLHGWRRAAVAALAGAFATLSLPPAFLLPVLFISLPILALLLDGADADPSEGRKLRRLLGRPGFFATGWWFGFGWFFASLTWVAEALLVDAGAHAWLIPFALVAIPAGLALFPALAAAVAGLFWTAGPWRLVVLAASLAGFEAVRGVVLTGFPWNGFHLGLAAQPLLMQGFALIGPSFASLLVLIVALVPAAFRPEGVGKTGIRYALAACVIAVFWLGYGGFRLAQPVPDTSSVAVRIVQPNIAQADKWDPAQREAHFASLLDLTAARASPSDLGLLGTTHVIWPESAFPFLLVERPDALAAIGEALPLGTHLLAGALRAETRGAGRVFTNALFAFNDRGEIIDAYDKVRLVPFGEALPFSDWFDRLGLRPIVGAPAGFVPGLGPGTLETPGGPSWLALICYEAIFPGFVRAGVRAHAPDYLLNVTNDAWFGTSAGPQQHVHQARLRAVETGRPLVRAANTGVSLVTDPYGRTIVALEVDKPGVITTNLPNPLTQTGYLLMGNLPFLVFLFLVLVVSVYHRQMNSRSAASSRP
ncbi:MAG: apolipoprotein N-acyltransferase [Devosiaceae bacterium]|nr:apolipoprotein N-acyltransferase [Devosiaceae bacterium MH13]